MAPRRLLLSRRRRCKSAAKASRAPWFRLAGCNFYTYLSEGPANIFRYRVIFFFFPFCPRFSDVALFPDERGFFLRFTEGKSKSIPPTVSHFVILETGGLRSTNGKLY